MDIDFAAWFFEELRRRDWSQSDLSARSGISQGAISKVIQGQRNPGIDFCQGIARAFQIPTETVMRAAGILPPIPEQEEEKEELDYLFNTLSAEGKQDLLTYARFLLAEQEKHA
jgi:transcriptional regulator with XRE-family HTH domain